VLFLDQGRIIEKGTFDELSQRGGRFTSLLRASGLLTDEGGNGQPKAIAS
jgi:ATP-binding cassette, subfamily B, beta-glucan exporter